MHNRLFRADQRLIGALDQVFPRLGQHLDGDVLRNQVLFDQRANEVKISLRCRGETNFDFLVSHPHQKIEHDALALRAHRID